MVVLAPVKPIAADLVGYPLPLAEDMVVPPKRNRLGTADSGRTGNRHNSIEQVSMLITGRRRLDQ